MAEAWFTADNLALAHEIISRYPVKKSALIPLLHLAQEQEGWVTDAAMRQIAELTDTTPAEVQGTGSFYEMFKFHPVGTYLVNVCTNLSCQLRGADEILSAIRRKLDVEPGQTTADARFSLDRAECLGSCGTAPVIQLGSGAYIENLDVEQALALVDRLAQGGSGKEG